jgi:hypothetical protein
MLALPLDAPGLLGISRSNLHLRQLRGGIHSKQLNLLQQQSERLIHRGANQVKSGIGALFFGSVGMSSRSAVCFDDDVVKIRASVSPSLADYNNGQSLTANAGPVELVDDRNDIVAGRAGLELPVPVDPAGRLARQQSIC